MAFLVLIYFSLFLRREEIDSMSVRALKQFLTQEGVDVTGMLEKQELIDKAKSLL